jgi:hypothetical protein
MNAWWRLNDVLMIAPPLQITVEPMACDASADRWRDALNDPLIDMNTFRFNSASAQTLVPSTHPFRRRPVAKR